MTKYKVELRTVDGKEITYRGVVEAPNVLNAIGQACLRFGVRTDTLVYLSVEAEAKD